MIIPNTSRLLIFTHHLLQALRSQIAVSIGRILESLDAHLHWTLHQRTENESED